MTFSLIVTFLVLQDFVSGAIYAKNVRYKNSRGTSAQTKNG